LFACLLSVAGAADAGARTAWLTVGEEAYRQLRAAGQPVTVIARRAGVAAGAEGVVALRVRAADVPQLARRLHRARRHCGGMMFHATEAQARAALARASASHTVFDAPPISQQQLVGPVLASMDEGRIAATIQALAAFPTRYHASPHGAQAAEWLQRQWLDLAAAGGVSVTLVRHAGLSQPSVVATVAGSEALAGEVVLGAHLDTISLARPADAPAPGADDDASGVASLTEVLRALLVHGVRPRRTITLIAYAAEEVGLRGSQDIARRYQEAGIAVAGVLQLDMVNYQGSDKDIYLISDYTDPAQNDYLARLAAAYLPQLRVDADRCGYACSDHASWHALGYAASSPFEARFRQANPAIHSARDTWAASGSQAAHALKFARLAAAWAIELAGAR
jgi:leucyl aminopeptidase